MRKETSSTEAQHYRSSPRNSITVSRPSTSIGVSRDSQGSAMSPPSPKDYPISSPVRSTAVTDVFVGIGSTFRKGLRDMFAPLVPNSSRSEFLPARASPDPLPSHRKNLPSKDAHSTQNTVIYEIAPSQMLDGALPPTPTEELASPEKLHDNKLAGRKSAFTAQQRPFSEFFADRMPSSTESVQLGAASSEEWSMRTTAEDGKSNLLVDTNGQKHHTTDQPLMDSPNRPSTDFERDNPPRPPLPRRTSTQRIISSLNPSRLFDFVAVVSLRVEDAPHHPREFSGGPRKQLLVPHVSYRFPPAAPVLASPSNEEQKKLSKSAAGSQHDTWSSQSTLSSVESTSASPSLLDNIPLFCFPEYGAPTGQSGLVEDFLKDERYVLTASSSGPTANSQNETFSFVLTDVDGSKRFGYCRRLLSMQEVEGEVPVKVPVNVHSRSGRSGVEIKDGVPVVTTYIRKKKRVPEVYCIISPVGCFALFSQILDIVEEKRIGNDDNAAIHAFLKSVIAHPFPKPGRTIAVRVPSTAKTMDTGVKQDADTSASSFEEYELHRPLDLTNLEHVSFHQLLSCLGIVSPSSLSLASAAPPFLTLVTLLSALLLERRVIFVSRSLQRLSDCCNAALAMIYPLDWQHVFIPILPRKLIDFVCSPTPYLVGILTADVGKVVPGYCEETSAVGDGATARPRREEVLPVEDVLVIHLDTGKVLRHDTASQDRTFLPTFLINRLKFLLEDALRSQLPVTPDEQTMMSVRLPFMGRSPAQSPSPHRSAAATMHSRPSATSISSSSTYATSLAQFSQQTSFNVAMEHTRALSPPEASKIPILNVPPPDALASVTAISKQASQSSIASNVSITSTTSTNRTQNLIAMQKRSAAIGGAFMHIFVLLMGPYRDYMDVDMVKSELVGEGSGVGSSTNNKSSMTRVKVVLNIDDFVRRHPLVVGQESAWMEEVSTSVGGGSTTLRASNTLPMVPTPAQRHAIRQLLLSITASQSFQYFAQIREEAFHFHYQSQLEKEQGVQKLPVAEERRTGKASQQKKDTQTGQKFYYALAQSAFEKRITHVEKCIQKRLEGKIVE